MRTGNSFMLGARLPQSQDCRTAPYIACNRLIKRFIFEMLRRLGQLTGTRQFGRLSWQACGVCACQSRGQHMIKSELVARLAERYPHLYHRDVERIVSTVLDEISVALAKGDRVELRGFGAFSVKVRPARQGRNPRTGEAVSVEEKRVPFFRTGKELRERLNNGADD